jgi:hypothetical protein
MLKAALQCGKRVGISYGRGAHTISLEPVGYQTTLHQRTRFVSISGIRLTDRGSLFGDIIAGITIASIIIPQSISYASSLAMLDPTTGLVSINVEPI